MAGLKKASPCEVCGGLVTHHGKDAGVSVSRKLTGVKRLIHEKRCKPKWDRDPELRARIMAKWPERQERNRHMLTPLARAQMDAVPVVKRTAAIADLTKVEEFVSSKIRQEIGFVRLREMQRLPKGTVGRWFDELKREHPEWLNGCVTGTFATHVTRIRQQIAYAAGIVAVPVESAPPPIAEQQPPPVTSPVVDVAPPSPIPATTLSDLELQRLCQYTVAGVRLLASRNDVDTIRTIAKMVGELV